MRKIGQNSACAILIVLGISALIAGSSSYGAPTGAVTRSLDPAAQNCTIPVPDLLQSTNSCYYRGEVEDYLRHCTSGKDATHPESLKFAAAKLAYLKLLFDREQMMVSRLYPVADHHQAWVNLKAKWSARLASVPAVAAMDNSTYVDPKERGSLQLRVNTIDALERKAAVEESKFVALLHRSYGPGFYMLAGALMVETYNAQFTKKALLYETAFARGKADRVILEQKDSFNTIYPEFMDGVNTTAVTHQFRTQTNLFTREKLAETVYADGPGNHLPPLEQRYKRLLIFMNQVLVPDGGANDLYLKVLDQIFARGMAKERARLDEDFERIQDHPDVLLRDGLVTTGAISMLTPEAALIQQGLQASQCQAIYSDRKWAYVNSLSEHYGGEIADGLLVVSLIGGEVPFLARFAAGRILGAPILRAFLTNGALFAGRLSAVTGTALLIAGPPWSAGNFYYHYQRYNKVSREFYETVANDDKARYRLDAVTPNTLRTEFDAQWWSGFNALINLAPLAFL